MQATSPHPSCALSSRAHFSRFLDGIKTKLAPHEYNTVCDVLLGTLAAPCAGQNSTQFKLTLSHNCAAGACSSGTCELCINSDSRPCPSLLKQKYLLGDLLLPACGASASVKLVRLGSSEDYVTQEDMRKLPPFILQVRAADVLSYAITSSAAGMHADVVDARSHMLAASGLLLSAPVSFARSALRH